MELTTHQINYKNNKERINSTYKRYYRRHRDVLVRKKKQYLLLNSEKYKKYQKLYRKTEVGRLRLLVAKQKRRRLAKLSNDNTVTFKSIKDMFLAQDNKCMFCAVDIRNRYHIDHIVSLSNGGAHSISNIQLLCPTCNIRKPRSI